MEKIYKDDEGFTKTYKIGESVRVYEPTPSDLWEHGFIGTIKGFREENIIVVDQEGDCFEVAEYLLEHS